MNKRIRYTKISDNLLRSKRSFYINGTDYLIEINTNENSFNIWDGCDVVATDIGTSLHSVKIKAKTAMEKLGAEFNQESRKR